MWIYCHICCDSRTNAWRASSETSGLPSLGEHPCWKDVLQSASGAQTTFWSLLIPGTMEWALHVTGIEVFRPKLVYSWCIQQTQCAEGQEMPHFPGASTDKVLPPFKTGSVWGSPGTCSTFLSQWSPKCDRRMQ